MSRGLARLVMLLAAAFLGVFFAWPVGQIVRGGFVNSDGRFTTAYLTAVLADPTYLAGLGNAFLIATATTIAALLIAVPFAWAAARLEFPGKTVLTSAVLAPLILPPFVGAIGLKQLFGQYGAVNGLLHAVHLLDPAVTVDWFARFRLGSIVLVEALSLYPIIFLNATAALVRIDPAMEEAAQNLGATSWRRFWRITLPLIRPGLFAGATIVFIWSFTELGTPLVFDFNRITSVQVYEGLKDIGGNPLPYTLVSVMLFTSVAIYALGRGIFGRMPAAAAAKATHAGGPRRLTGGAAWLPTAAFVGLSLVALLPHLAVTLVAFSRDWFGTVLPTRWTWGNFQLALGHDLAVPAIANSIRFATAATVIDVVLGVAIAYVVVRSRLRFRQALDVGAMLPLAVPGLVLAFGYVAMTQDGRAFAFLNPTRNPTVLLIIAYSIRRLPYVVRSAAAGLEQASETFEEAAQNLGCPPLKSVWRVTLPLIRTNLIGGALLALAFAMLEVSDSLILAQKQVYYPITKAILELFQLLGDGRYLASALGVWAMVFLGLVLAVVSMLLGRRLSALFRL